MDANKLLSAEGIEERAAYYSKWAEDIRAMNGVSVDADHSEQTAFVLRALIANAMAQQTRLETLEKERDAAIHDRVAANNNWRLDYNAVARERDVLRQGLEWFADGKNYGADASAVPVNASAIARGVLNEASLSTVPVSEDVGQGDK